VPLSRASDSLVQRGMCHHGFVRRIASVALLAAGLLLASGSGSSAERAAAPVNLRAVNWSGVTLPAVCGGSRAVRLHRPSWARGVEGTALVTPIPRRWSQDAFYGRHSVEVDTGWIPVVYGDLEGHPGDAAGLVFDCNNGSGTADGVLLYGSVIFSGLDGRLSVVGVVTAQARAAAAGPLEITIAPGKITAHETIYGPSDPTCCASGRATTVWTYSHGHLQPGVSVVTKQPATRRA
jgi:hypothetical protein